MDRAPLRVIDAPSNLGLRPPAPGTVPGVYRLAGALRDQGLLARIGAAAGGVVTPPRSVADWQPGAGLRNGAAIGRYARRLADRVGAALDAGAFSLVLGGDGSILLGNMLALRRRGRFGLVFIDGHSDFRHPGNAPAVGAAAGEDLALVTGRGGELAKLDGRGPLVADHDVVVIGVRGHDEHLAELDAAGISVVTAPAVRERGAAVAAQAAQTLARRGVERFWIHCDADVLDAAVLPAVDTPEPDGLGCDDLPTLLGGLLRAGAVGLEVTIYDPDLDEDGVYAQRLVDCLCRAFTRAAARE
ncbi:MAG: arginase family protein [Sphaerobacter sp.]|nr:arginase family protein [Sphaerobacter sp.]